jgi:hypothetical protein
VSDHRIVGMHRRRHTCEVLGGIFEDNPVVVMGTVYIGNQFVKDHDCFIILVLVALFHIRGFGNLYLQQL